MRKWYYPELTTALVAKKVAAIPAFAPFNSMSSFTASHI
tara:strand:+ start:26 stop:142 length:117 start_codon:yes stop_codon:yes gene_type:complete